MDKQDAICPYNGILYSPKKEGHSDTCYNTDEIVDILFSEIHQSQKLKYCMILLL